MGFIAVGAQRNFIYGNIYRDMSIAIDRWYYLLPLAYKYKDNFKLAFRDPESGAWTKWEPFPSLLWIVETDDNCKPLWRGPSAAIDVHRSVLENEIVIESDYPTFEENYEASKIVGAIIEQKGFVPHYYYSGNKSIHIHVFLDLRILRDVDNSLQEKARKLFGDTHKFLKAFMEWLRAKMINCWDTGVRKFDSDLVRASHLIRAELSRNKLGYKTFLGYSWKDMSPIPYVCNEENRIYPRIGKRILSKPLRINDLMEEFLNDIAKRHQKYHATAYGTALGSWMPGLKQMELRACAKAILADSFKGQGDGFQRGMFILVNELKRVMGIDQARILLKDWNTRMGNRVPERDIDYRLGLKDYTLSCDYIHEFLKGLGIAIPEKCNGKVYKGS